MIGLVLLNATDFPESIVIDDDNVNIEKLTSTNAVYINKNTILIVDEGKCYCNKDSFNKCELFSINCQCNLKKLNDEISIETFVFNERSLEGSNENFNAIWYVFEKDKFQTFDNNEIIETNVNVDNAGTNQFSGQQYVSNETVTTKDVLQNLNNQNFGLSSQNPASSKSQNNNVESIQKSKQQQISFNLQKSLDNRNNYTYNNQNYQKGHLKQQIDTDNLKDIEIDEFLSTAIDSGLTLKDKQLKLIRHDGNKVELKKHVLIHNAYVKFNQTGNQADIIKTSEIFDDDRVNKDMQKFIRDAELIKISNVSGRIDILIETLKDPYCIAICLQIPYFSITKAVEPGLWTKGINYTFKNDGVVKKYTLFAMCENLTVKQIDKLRACAPVIAFLLSNNKMSKFHTDKKIFYLQSNLVVINTSPFIESCTKNLSGSNKTKVNDKIRSNINKMVECLASIDKQQFNDINNIMAIALKQFKGNIVSNFFHI